MKGTGQHCYNSASCIVSVLVIVFILGSILYDMSVTKPRINKNIDEIKTELVSIKSQLSNVVILPKIEKDSIK